MIVSISKSGISRRGSDHCVRSRSDLSRSIMLWTKRQVTCLLSGQLIHKADRMLMVKTLRGVPSPQQWWNPIWGDILGNLNPLKKMSWQILGLSFQGAFLSIVWWLKDNTILIHYSHGYVWGGYWGVCYKELHTFQIPLSAPVWEQFYRHKLVVSRQYSLPKNMRGFWLTWLQSVLCGSK